MGIVYFHLKLKKHKLFFFKGYQNSVDASISFTCNTGYHIIGHQTATCASDENWKHGNVILTEPRCEPNTCPERTSHENGSINVVPPNNRPMWTFDTTATFSCNEGYELTADYDVITCQRDGTWDRHAPSCTSKIYFPLKIVRTRALLKV